MRVQTKAPSRAARMARDKRWRRRQIPREVRGGEIYADGDGIGDTGERRGRAARRHSGRREQHWRRQLHGP